MRRATATALALLGAYAGLLLVPVSAADAAVRWSLRGAGWGHGIGMSQYGALGFARAGSTYRQIVGHYYSGTSTSRIGGGVARVLLDPNQSSVSFTGAERAGDRSLTEASVYRAVRRGETVVLQSRTGRRLAVYAGVLPVYGGSTFRVLGGADNGVRNGLYRGSLEVRTARGPGLNAINVVGIDDYVRGVVPAEVPPVWPPEALKAQAVAARTYALATGVGGLGFNQYADTRSQVYRGFNAETAATNSAVAETSGEVVTYNGAIVVTYFFSTSGGHTENVENVFTRSPPRPWLQGVDDPHDDASPYHRWGPFTFSRRDIERRLGGLVRGRFRRLDVLDRGVSPRVVSARIVGSRGTVGVTGAQLRTELGLRDTWFYLRRVKSKTSPARARVSSGTRALTAISGEVDPAPSRFVRLERRAPSASRWELVALVPLDRAKRLGRYRFHVAKPGQYRITAGWAVGPVVKVP